VEFQPGPNDVIIIDGRFYVPFAPFPAILLMPLVAVIVLGSALGSFGMRNSIILMMAPTVKYGMACPLTTENPFY